MIMAVTLLSAIEAAMHKGTVTNYRYANGVKREDERERGREGRGKMGMSRGKSARTHPRIMYKEINLNELICHISLGRGRHSGRDFGPAFHTETEERNLH